MADGRLAWHRMFAAAIISRWQSIIATGASPRDRGSTKPHSPKKHFLLRL